MKELGTKTAPPGLHLISHFEPAGKHAVLFNWFSQDLDYEAKHTTYSSEDKKISWLMKVHQSFCGIWSGNINEAHQLFSEQTH